MPLRLRLDPAPDSGARARRAVASWLASHDLADCVDDVTLLTSELVTNALRHGAGPLDLTLDLAGDRLRVAVRDRGPGVPEPRAASLDDTGGRGLTIVSALAVRWGVDAEVPAGKVVWAELAVGPPAG